MEINKITLFDAFSGLGAAHEALKELGIEVELTGISEIDVNAIISYAAKHIDNFKNIPFTFSSDEEMKEYLMDRNIGYDFDKQKSSIPRMKKDKLKWCYKATILLNNMGDISILPFNEIPDSDIFNFTFPCTDYSQIGKQEGSTKEDGSITHSGLYKYGIEAIKVKKFKYIMIENVKGLIQKKFIDDFYSIVRQIEDLGYNYYFPTKEDKKENKVPTCLNAKDYGVPQNRERIFVICVRKDIDDNLFEFPKGFDNGLRLKDFLENDVDKQYYLSDKYVTCFKEMVERKNNKEQLDKHDNMDFISRKYQEFILKNGYIPKLFNPYNCTELNDYAPTQTAQGASVTKSSSILIYDNNRLRRHTSLESMLLMGFSREDYNKIKEMGISDTQIYRLAGNSIVVNVLYYIFKKLFNK